jgi:hypothetical protein
LRYICDIALLITDDILAVKPFVFTLWGLHIFKVRCFLDKANEDYLLIDLREGFDLESHLSQVTVLATTKKLLSEINNVRLSCFKVALNQPVMSLGYRPWNNTYDVLANDFFPVET